MDYPPEPWVLHGRMYVSVWALRRAELPRLPDGLARAVRPVALGGRALVGAAWVVYEPGGILHYRELLSATLVRAGWRPRVSITHIWVDDPVSRDGGRELWGIPKDLAELEIGTSRTAVDGSAEAARTAPTEWVAPSTRPALVAPAARHAPVDPAARPAPGEQVSASARTASGPVARAVVRAGRRLPGRWPIRFRVAQLRGTHVRVSPVRCRTTIGTAAATWSVDPAGPLAHLAARRPLFTLVLPDFRMVFGSASPAPDASVAHG